MGIHNIRIRNIMGERGLEANLDGSRQRPESISMGGKVKNE